MTPKALSREIKFRVYDNHFKMINDWLAIKEMSLAEILEENSDIFIVMQYTGLHDKNGKEIYEGDKIVGPMYAINSFVIFDERYATFKAQSGTQLTPLGYECQIIGNIYENPELLTKENK